MKINSSNQDINDCNTFFFSLKISITPLSFSWSNDTPTFCHLTDSSPNQFVPDIVSRLPRSSGLVRPTLQFVYFRKELISFIWLS